LIFEIESEEVFTAGNEALPVDCSSGKECCAVDFVMLFFEGSGSIMPSLAFSLLFSTVR